MSNHHKPWTFEPFELEAEKTWSIYDPNLATLVATFYDEGEARRYLKWRNKQQAKRKARQEDTPAWIAATVRAAWSGDGIDDDGRC